LNFIEEKYLHNIESLFLLCFIWGNLKFVSKVSESDLTTLVENRLRRYRKVLSCKFEKPNFGNNLSELLSQKFTIFDVFYDLINEKWILLSEFKISTNKMISKELALKTLSPQEIIRLNPKAIQLEEIQTQIDNEKDSYTFLPHNQLFIETKHSKVSRFFLEYLIAYEKNFALVSGAQNGKNITFQEIIRGKIEKNELKSITVAYDRDANIESFQEIVERHYVKKGFDNYWPNANQKAIIYIDDFNLAGNLEEKPGPMGCLRSLIEHKGWWSKKNMRYRNLAQTSLAISYSFSLFQEVDLYSNLNEFNLSRR